MPTKLGDLLFDVRARTTAFDRDLSGAERMARRSARRIKTEFNSADLSALNKQIKSSSAAMLAFGGDAAKGFGQASAAVRSLSGAFLAGGGIGLGLAGAGLAIGKVVEEVQKTRAASAQLDVMNQKWGVTKERVESVRDALVAYGVNVDSAAAQSIVKLGREAKLTEPEIAGLGRRMLELMNLEGVDAETAAKKAISEVKRDAQEAIEILEKGIAAQKSVSLGAVVDAGAKGLVENLREQADAQRTLVERYRELKQAEDELARLREARAARLAGGNEAGASAYKIDEQRTSVERLAQAYKLAEERVRDLGDEQQRIVDLEKEWLGNDSRERLAEFARGIHKATERIREQRAEEAKRLAEARAGNHFDVLIERARLLGDKEKEINERRKKAQAELTKDADRYTPEDLKERRAQVDTQADAEVEKLHRDRGRAALDFDLQMEAERAKATKSRIDDLEAELARETEMVRRSVEDGVLAFEEGERRKQALTESYQVRIGAAASDEAARHRKEIEASILKEDQIKERATIAGINAGAAFAQGLKSAIQSGDATDAIGGLLSGLGMVLSAAGNPVAGAGLGAFAGFFADGGEIVGPGGGKTDSIIARVSAGEYIQPHESVQKFGVHFMDRLREGVLDLGALPRFATGGVVGAAASTAHAGATATTTYQVVAFDPRSMLDVIGSTVEPAQYRRGVSRADAKALAGMRRRIRPPRSGRLT